MEIGHVSLDPVNGLPCTCGMRGCLEMTISGKGIVAQARQQRADYPDSCLWQGEITTREIIKAAEANDPLARYVMHEAGRALGIACAWCVNLFNPQLIVLAGGLITAAYHLLEAPMQREMCARSLPINCEAVDIKWRSWAMRRWAHRRWYGITEIGRNQHENRNRRHRYRKLHILALADAAGRLPHRAARRCAI